MAIELRTNVGAVRARGQRCFAWDTLFLADSLA
jgi:hypothetical protein